MKNGLVSVIMPTYNETKFIEQSIDSVLSQTYTNLELLITDDASSNKEIHKILEHYSRKDSRVKVFYLAENQGAGVARNNSIQHACGQYIAFCDSDDRWFPDKLERQLAFMQERNCCFTYSSYILCDQDNKEIGIINAPERITLDMMKRDNRVGCLTAIYDTARFGKFYMPTLRKRQDWGLFLTIMKSCGEAYGITEPMAYYRMRPDSISSNKLSLLKYNAKVYQNIFGYSVPKSYCYLTFMFLPTYAMKQARSWINSRRYLSGKQR